MKNLPKLFISIGGLQISLIVGQNNDQNSFEFLEKQTLPFDGINENRITDLDKIVNAIKKSIFIIEQKVNYTFKDVILIFNNFDISFLNLCGFKKLNGTQISKENITYILNLLKSCVDEFEKNKKILHIFNSKYCLDKKKLDNLPIGLFGNFYSHELSFSLINKNDFKNLENIFKKCNLKIKKILLESFVKGSFVNDTNPKIESFFYIEIKDYNSKIFYVENNAIKFEQRFNFGTEIILKDICKVTSLNYDTTKNIILNNESINAATTSEILDKNFFINQEFRKIRKKLISDIADSRVKELSELLYLKNVNFKCFLQNVDIIFLEIEDQQHLKCFKEIYERTFTLNNRFELKLIKTLKLEDIIKTAAQITDYGWIKEVIPVTKPKKTIISRIFNKIFQ